MGNLIQLGEEFPDVFVDPLGVDVVYLQKTYSNPADYYRIVVVTAGGREFQSKNKWKAEQRDEAVRAMSAVIARVTSRGE